MTAAIETIRTAASDWSIEVTPTGATKIESFRDCLAPGTSVNVTFLPGSDPRDTIAVAERLHNDGMRPVPHLAARSLQNAGKQVIVTYEGNNTPTWQAGDETAATLIWPDVGS